MYVSRTSYYKILKLYYFSSKLKARFYLFSLIYKQTKNRKYFIENI